MGLHQVWGAISPCSVHLNTRYSHLHTCWLTTSTSWSYPQFPSPMLPLHYTPTWALCPLGCWPKDWGQLTGGVSGETPSWRWSYSPTRLHPCPASTHTPKGVEVERKRKKASSRRRRWLQARRCTKLTTGARGMRACTRTRRHGAPRAAWRLLLVNFS